MVKGEVCLRYNVYISYNLHSAKVLYTGTDAKIRFGLLYAGLEEMLHSFQKLLIHSFSDIIAI